MPITSTNQQISGSTGVTSVAGTAPILSSGGTTPAISLDSTAAITQSNIITGTALKSSGLTGATAASRYVGATSTGAPASGTFLVGDFVIDQTGKVYICTTAGTPGTWTQVGSGGGGALTLISRQILTAAATTVTFTSIPSTYTCLRMTVNCLWSGSSGSISMQFNGVTTSTYTWWGTMQVINGTNTNAVSPNYANVITAATAIKMGLACAGWTLYDCWFPDYASTDRVKKCMIYGATYNTVNDSYNFIHSGSSNSNSAITSISLTAVNANGFGVGSQIALFGEA